MTKIFVTGFHRAGSHTLAERLAKENSLPYIEETVIGFNNYVEVSQLMNGKYPNHTRNLLSGQVLENNYIDMPELKEGFVLQCPGIAHKVIELNKLGEVYWATREHIGLVTSMRNIDLNNKAWIIMNAFHDGFPDDPIWKKLSYDGSMDKHYGFVDYYSLLVKVKEYFYQTRFKGLCVSKALEQEIGFDREETMSFKKPLKTKEEERANGGLDKYASLCIY